MWVTHAVPLASPFWVPNTPALAWWAQNQGRHIATVVRSWVGAKHRLATPIAPDVFALVGGHPRAGRRVLGANEIFAAIGGGSGAFRAVWPSENNGKTNMLPKSAPRADSC